MKFLLDTNIIVDHLRGKKPLDEIFKKQGFSISVITFAELMYGAYKSENSSKNIKLLKILFENPKIDILPVEKHVSVVYARLKSYLENKGQKLDEFDLLIASSAILYNLVLVTRNVKHFKRIPNLEMY